MDQQQRYFCFALASVARLFCMGKPICREDFVRRVDMEQSIPEEVKRFTRHLQFDDAVVGERGEILLDMAEGHYSDA